MALRFLNLCVKPTELLSAPKLRVRNAALVLRNETSYQALTSELPTITDMVQPSRSALRLPRTARPLRAAGRIAPKKNLKIFPGRI